jgi:hypothetical protein
MKQVLLISVLSFLFGKPDNLPEAKKDKIFYYFDSRAWDRNDFSKKQVIQYAEIKELANNVDSVRKKLLMEWGSLAHQQCENASGCTVDLNWYPSYEAAKIEYDKMIKKYSDTSRYIIKKRNF